MSEQEFQKMTRMMEIFNLFQKLAGDAKQRASFENGEKVPKINAAFLKPNYYDDQIHTPALRSIKSAIPYLEPKYRKTMGILIKMIELQKLLEMYSSQVKAQDWDMDWRKGMLLAIRPHLEDDKKKKVDLLVTMLDMQEILSKFDETQFKP